MDTLKGILGFDKKTDFFGADPTEDSTKKKTAEEETAEEENAKGDDSYWWLVVVAFCVLVAFGSVAYYHKSKTADAPTPETKEPVPDASVRGIAPAIATTDASATGIAPAIATTDASATGESGEPVAIEQPETVSEAPTATIPMLFGKKRKRATTTNKRKTSVGKKRATTANKRKTSVGKKTIAKKKVATKPRKNATTNKKVDIRKK